MPCVMLTRYEGAKRSQHGPSGVQYLQFVVAVEVFLLPAQLQDIIGIVSGRLSALIGVIIVFQGTQPPWSLWTIPWAASISRWS